MIDWKRVLDLREEVGADEFEPVLELFIDEVEHLLMQLSIEDAGQLERAMHFLKGSAWNLGFVEFGERCRKVEMQAARADLKDVSIEDIVSCYSTSKQKFMRDLPHAIGNGSVGDVEVA